MNNEEKKAIEMLDKFITEHKLYNIKQSDDLENNIKILLNLIEKQQEELNKEKEKNNELLYKLQQKVIIETHEQIKNNFISKDKIKEKIKEFEYYLNTEREIVLPHEKIKYSNQISILQQLLEEE